VESVCADRAVALLAGGHRAEVPTGAAHFTPGGGAMVMVRPERIRLAATPPSVAVNAIPVTLEEMIFQGPVVRFVLRDGAGCEIIAHLDDDERPSGIARGAALWATWDPSASRLLPRPTS
jgi:putative spermidine/putrescine transport system ATP-binding protein